MPQNAEAQSFLTRIAQLPPGAGAAEKLTDVLQPSLDDEAELRKLFAQDKTHARVVDPYVGLVDLFDAPGSVRTTRARVVADDADLSARFVMPLASEKRRKEGEPAMVGTLDDFKKNWAIFSEGALSGLADWKNVIVAGGAVQACLTPVPASAQVSKRALRKHYHNVAYPTSDVDLFLYGMTLEQAELKIVQIYEAVRDSVPWDVTCIRTKHTVSIHSQYPYRAVQIVLRLYSSPAEILAGFDVDAPCCAYDGTRVWASPRAIVAMMRQCNTVDVTRRSPSYEVRLSKYSERDFEIYVPTLKREEVDPTIYERSILRIQGLARLLVLEKLKRPEARNNYLTERRDLRGRPQKHDSWRRNLKKRYKGDLKADADDGLELSSYDIVSLHIPYGPGWDARRIEKLVYQTDLAMNSPYNPKNKDRRLHRHSAFFGTIQECMEDCCEYCIEPKNDEEKALQEEEDKSYVRGRISFIEEDPGRQSISGSFNPIDDGEWAEQAYMGAVEKLFHAIAQDHRARVAEIVQQEGTELDRRDHVGRTALQLAVMCGHVSIVCDLIDAGARMTCRLADGRSVLHLAAQLDLPQVIHKLLERSAVNAEKAEEEAKQKAQEEMQKKGAAKSEEKMDVDDEDQEGEDEGKDHSSEDDWASDEDEKKPAKKPKDKGDADDGQIPEDEEDESDVFDLNAPDWDLGFTPLQFAIVSGSLSVLDELIAAGADVKLLTKAPTKDSPVHQLTTTLLTMDEEKAAVIATKLFAAGAVSSEADDDLRTILHHVVCADRPQLLSAFLRSDPSAKTVIDCPRVLLQGQTQTPLVSAVESGAYATLAVLLAFNARLEISEAEWHRAQEARKVLNTWRPQTYRTACIMPLEVALARCDNIAYLLVALGADVNALTMESQARGGDTQDGLTLLEWVRFTQLAITRRLEETYVTRAESAELEGPTGWKAALADVLKVSRDQAWDWERKCHEPDEKEKQHVQEVKDYFKAMEDLLVSHGAKTWDELYPDSKRGENASQYMVRGLPVRNPPTSAKPQFCRATGNTTWQWTAVPDFQIAAYEELFEACWNGDSDTVQRLCLPQEGETTRVGPLQIVSWYSEAHFTTLALAVQQRHWDTARLIVAIAHAQHQKDETRVGKFSTRHVVLDEESASEDEDEDEDMEEHVPNFRDIAKLPSAVQTRATPQLLLETLPVQWLNKERNLEGGSVIRRAVILEDFEAFTHILDIYKASPSSLRIPTSILDDILVHDQPDMLDEYIRRTGMGVEVNVVADESEIQEKAKPNPKVYLGLNVHGKKRKDLASKGDPSAPVLPATSHMPLLWQAAKLGAIKVIKYLSGERPLAAYQYYARTHSDERALFLRRKGDLADILHQWLGWARNNLNESAISMAVLYNKLEAVKTLMNIKQTEMIAAITTSLKFVELNHLLLGVMACCSTELFDYLLEQGISPNARDHRGWNILHVLCARPHSSKGQVQLLKHILHVLPRDLLLQLCRQMSKNARNTPLHLAVAHHRVDIVGLLLDVSSSSALHRNAAGMIPLHRAVKDAQAEITRLLVQAGPVEALFMEDAVGKTPFEVAGQNALQSKVFGSLPPHFTTASILHEHFCQTMDRRPVPSLLRQGLDTEVPRFRATMQELLQLSRLRMGTKLTTELLAFADRMERQLTETAHSDQESSSEEKDLDEPRNDQHDPQAVLCTIVNAVSAHGDHKRHLIHLSDVLESVRMTMDSTVRMTTVQSAKGVTPRDDDGLAAEADKDDQSLSILKTSRPYDCPDAFDPDTY